MTRSAAIISLAGSQLDEAHRVWTSKNNMKSIGRRFRSSRTILSAAIGRSRLVRRKKAKTICDGWLQVRRLL